MPAPTSKIVTPLHTALTTALQGVDAIADYATVLKREPKQTLSDVDAAIAQLALCVLVFPPLIKRLNRNLPGPYAEEIELRFRIVESPVLNATGVDAYTLVEQVLIAIDALQLEWPDDAGIYFNPLAGDATPVREIDDPDNVVFDIVYTTSGGLDPRA